MKILFPGILRLFPNNYSQVMMMMLQLLSWMAPMCTSRRAQTIPSKGCHIACINIDP